MKRQRRLAAAVILIVVSAATLWAGGKQEQVQGKVNLRFAYPVEVAGPLAKIINTMTQQFSMENPRVNVTPIYAGSYWETMDKIKVMVLGGNPPDVAILAKTNLLALIDIDAIVPFDPYLKQKGDAYINDFFPAFLTNSKWDNKIWSMPFQNSSPLLYYNQEALQEAGLDPNRPPDTWDEVIEYSKKLVRRDTAGNVVRWGVEIPPSDHWFMGALVLQNGGKLENELGNEVYFDQPATVEAIQFWVDLANKHKVSPAMITPGIGAADYAKRATAMMYSTTGSLTFVKNNATFKHDVAFLPKKKQRACYSGGGVFFIFKGVPKRSQDAAFEFVEWMTQPERAAQWSRDTGYLAVRKSAWEVPEMKKYTTEFPQALMALKQLEYTQRELMTHNFPAVAQLLVTAVQDAIAGKVDTKEALSKAQVEAMKVLAPFRK